MTTTTVIVISAIKPNGKTVTFGCKNGKEAALVQATYAERGYTEIMTNLQQRYTSANNFAVIA